jgi:uncharacterized protein (DUF433 family)
VTTELERIVMPEFSEGICHDGAAILVNGHPITVDEILERLKRGAEAEKLLHEALPVIDMLGLQDVYIDYGKRTSVQVDIEMFLGVEA